MIERVLDPEVIAKVTEPYVDGLDPISWTLDDKNVALRQNDDYSFFHYEKPGLFSGHWFFQSRGKQAKATAIDMLDCIFSHYPVECILGFTPLTNLGARWLAKHIGFQSQGVVLRRGKHYEFFLLTKQQWTNK